MISSLSFAQGELKLLTSIHGEKTGDYFTSLDAIGDINGDGFNDFIIGANDKYVKLYFGGSPFDTLTCIKYLNGVRKRVSVSGCGKGDLNGDGYNDFVINSTYDVNDYRVYVYFGGKDKDTTADLVITNNIWYSNFGARAINGDLNGDGYKDLVASAPNDDYDAHGRLYIYYGGKNMDTVCDVFLEGKDHFDMFGSSVAIVGDVNGDGYDDLLVGAPQSLANKKPGKAYLFLGGKTIGFDNCIEFDGDSTDRSYGIKVAGLGDINGDGVNDFAIVSGKYIDIFSGKTLKKLFRVTSNKKFWYPLNIAGGYDLNKDGYCDFLVSYADLENQYAGGVDLYLGGKELDTLPIATINGKNPNSYFGKQLIISGDINNDGSPEIMIGEDGELTQDGVIGSGTVYIYEYNKLDGIKNPTPLLPNKYKLYSNYPNPFNPSTTIKYDLPKTSHVIIKIFDSVGKEITSLINKNQLPGSYTMNFNANNLSSGVYFYKIITDEWVSTKKMILIK